MSRFASLPETPHLSDVFRAFPRGVEPLLAYHDAILRSDSPLTVGQRELIAAYVSGLNACGFCFGAHRSIARAYGIDEDLFARLVEEPGNAGVEARLLPMLAYVRKLTEAPATVSDRDAQAVFAAGWDEQALYDAICVCALFNFMNRLVEGMGVPPQAFALTEAQYPDPAQRPAFNSYREFGRSIGVIGEFDD